jgi:ubiquinone/menaquinone biosynthesis C-methylase UbiE
MSGPLLDAEAIWRRYDGVESRLTAPLSERMLDLADLRPGMRVLDLATGRGEPALRAARRVGPEGFVLGVDVSEPMMRMARERAEREGLGNLELRVADAELLEDLPAGHFHVATVRWGLMYMDAPVAALQRARRALVPTGVLVAALLAEPERVSWYTLPRRLLGRHAEVQDPDAPGPFRHAALEHVAQDFQRAGFVLDHVEEMDVSVFEAETAEEIVAWVRAFGLTKLLDELPEADQRAWEGRLMQEMERRREGKWMRLGGVTRIVRARLGEPGPRDGVGVPFVPASPVPLASRRVPP